MNLIAAFVREQKRYSKEELMTLFQLESMEADAFLNRLYAFGILKTVPNSVEQRDLSELLEDDFTLSFVGEGDGHFLYVFTFVGVVTCQSRVIKSYPKYILSNEQPLPELKQVLKVLAKYAAKEQEMIHAFGDRDSGSFHMLSVILYLIQDYYESGLYTSSQEYTECDGQGEILWETTMNEAFVFLRNGRPYYTELYTARTVDDESDLIRRVHAAVLTQCSDLLEAAGLLELFDLETLLLSEESVEVLGDLDYLKSRLQAELSVQFSTRKQQLLQTLYTFLEASGDSEDVFGLSLYGTNQFHQVWEAVCAAVFHNHLYSKLDQLSLPLPLDAAYRPSDRLIDLIEKPLWIPGGKQSAARLAAKTLIPDAIFVGALDAVYCLMIFDAKYYTIQLEEDKALRGYPGVGDVTKQYLYQLAYQDFCNRHGIRFVGNYFFMPTEGTDYRFKGLARMEMLRQLCLLDIEVWQLPAEELYAGYLSDRFVDMTRILQSSKYQEQ